MYKHKLEFTFCTCHNLNPNMLSSSKLLPSKQRSTIFFCLWLFKRKLEQIPFCTCHNPIQRHVHFHSYYPQAKNVPPRLQKQNCTNCILRTYSTRTVHGAVYATVHGHKTLKIPWDWGFVDNLQKTIEIFLFCVF